FGEWLALPRGPLLYAAPVFAGVTAIVSLFHLLLGFQLSPGLIRRGGVPVLIGLLIAIIGSTITSLNLLPNPDEDVLTVNLAITMVVAPLFALAIFRGCLFELKPTARSVVFGGLKNGIVVLDQNGVVQDANPAALRYLQATEDAVVGVRGATVVRDHLGLMVPELRDMAPREVVVLVDGQPRDLEIVVSPFHNDWGDDIGHLMTIHDITERKAVERLKNEFISVVSHELRTPLTSIRGSLGLLRGGVAGPLPEQATSLVEIAYQNTDRLSRLINDILDIEKIDGGAMAFATAPHELGTRLEQAVAANEHYAKPFGVRLALVKATDEPCWVAVDPYRLDQVLANLLSNAVKFSPSGSVVTVTLSATATSARVAVTDQGPGIPAEFRHRIFQRFAQADSSSTRARGGAGLGLSISKTIIERMGGTIDYHSDPGHGATFFFDLPRVTAPATNAATETSPEMDATAERSIARNVVS
ncbi:MAG: ATP-binding protein, partial [Dehalococcoidia bacterium]|nr:ATP-binding protein [Dehalococcoidia bacterium]